MHESLGQPVILAVDDAADSLGLLSAVLEKAGMTALAAPDGQSAVALLEHAVPDLILMDALMPVMDGFAAARAIKADARYAHIPIIFMTGLSEPEDVVRGFDAGGVDYITKPIVPEILLARVRTHLSNARLAHSARRALDAAGAPLMAAREDGAIAWITPEGVWRLGGAPESWRIQVAPVLAGIIVAQLDSVELPGTQMFASFIGESQPGEYLLRLKDAQAPSEHAILKKQLSLTDREAEVLVWIAKGKSSRDIAAILDCSPRTVTKHLEQIYQKMQVENRTAAAMRAIQVLSES